MSSLATAKTLGAIAASVALAGGLLFAGGTSAQTPAPPIALGTITVAPEDLPVITNLPGRIAPTRIAEVRPRVSGIVVERVFRQGSPVKQGDVLYRIDPAPFALRVRSAEATLKRAEAIELQARQQADRVQELRSRNVASPQQSDNAISALAQADADVASARAGLASAQLDLEYSEVRAPISGRIGRALITEGALVSSSSVDNLATIQQLDPVYADVTQSVADLLALRRALTSGSLSRPDSETVRARLLLDTGSPYPHVGRLLFSEASVEATTGQVTLRAEFPNPNDDLLPGMYVRVEIEQGVEKNAILIPQQAIQRDARGQPQVHLLKADGTLEVRHVKAGRVVGNRQVIEAGLAARDQVVVEGFQKIAMGTRFVGTPWTTASRSDGARQAD
jgi:membrane fusion protein (multidrug efflux system)